MSRIFISCSSKDNKAALALCKAIEARGYPCWLASRDVGAGQNFQEEIVRAIRAAPLMVLVFSANANTSSEIKKELALASQAQMVVVPVRLEDVAPSGAFVYELATRQWIDLFDDWDEAVERLVQQLDLTIPPSTDAPKVQPQAAPQAATKGGARMSANRARLLAAGGLALLLLAGGGIWLSRTAPPSGDQPAPPRLNAKVQQVVDMARVIERRARISAKKARAAALQARQAQVQAEAAAKKAEDRVAGYGIVTGKNARGVAIRWAGQVAGGKGEGFAVVTWSAGQRLAGEFQGDDWKGVGVETFPGLASRYEGEVESGSANGFGVDLPIADHRYEGELKKGQHSGLGVFRTGTASLHEDSIGQITGQFLNGYGVNYLEDGNVMAGQFKNDELDGYGAKYDAKGVVVEQGLYKEGILQTPLKAD